MTQGNNITIKFKSSGEKALKVAIKALADEQDRLNGKFKGYVKATKSGVKNNRLLDNSFATLRSKMLLVNFAFGMGIKQLAGFVKESAKVKSMETAFNTLAGATENSSDAMQKLKDATGGTMNEFDLFQQANNAMILGVSKNSDEMAEMFDIAQRLGRALGRDTASSVESLITGIGRQSRLMLDNIGIIVKSDEAYKTYAEALNTTADKLSDAEKKQAFFNATMESARSKVSLLGDETRTAQDSFDALSATISNAFVTLGERATPAFEKLATRIDNLFKTDNEEFLELLQRLNVAPEFQAQIKAEIEEESFVRFEDEMKKRLNLMTRNLSRDDNLEIFGAGFQGLHIGSKDFTKSLAIVDEKLESIKFDKLVLPADQAKEIAKTEIELKKIQQILELITVSTGAPTQIIPPETLDHVNGFSEEISTLTKFNDDLVKAQGLLNVAEAKGMEGSEKQIALNKIKVAGLAEKAKIDAKIMSLTLQKEEATDAEKVVIEKIIPILEKAKQKGIEARDVERGAVKTKHQLIDALKLEETQKLMIAAMSDGELTFNEERLISNQKILELQAALNLEGANTLAINKQIFAEKKRLMALEDVEQKMQSDKIRLAGKGIKVGADIAALNSKNAKEVAQIQAIASGVNAFAAASDAHAQAVKNPITIANPMYPNIIYGLTLAQGLAAAAAAHKAASKMEQGGLVGGRRHSAGGTMIEAEQGEYVMSRNAVNAVGIEAMNRINAGGGAGGINISFSGNVMSQDFIENEAIPQIKEAIRRGADIGVS